MRHYRILEKKKDEKTYIIQYTQKLFFGLFFWKKLNNMIYYKYEDAFNIVKGIITQTDYETLDFGYHYVDAYKIFKPKEIKKINATPITITKTKTITSTQIVSAGEKKLNKSTFVPKK
jgi:hypothetical protein